MAIKTRYTEEFKKKVVEEYKKGNHSLQNVAEKYGMPCALLQDWINKGRLDDFFISYVEKPEVKTNLLTKVKATGDIVYKKIKTKGWLLVGCLLLLICLTVFVKYDRKVVESEVNENRNSTEFKMDSLVIINNELIGKIEKLGVELENIDNKLEMKIIPNISINSDNRRTSQKTSNNVTKNKSGIDKEIKTEDHLKTIPKDSCCSHCPKDTIK
jgi:hypothetical protein